MRVLTVFAHPGRGSFCHAVLERFDAGLREAGHTNEIVDLYAIGFDPVLREHDNPNWMDADAPEDVLASMHLRERILEGAGGPLRRFALKRWLGDRDTRGIIRLLQRHRPKDVTAQQRKVRAASALAFIAPMYFVGFPAILKGWIERVFSLGFAYRLAPEGWKGDISGRIPLLTHREGANHPDNDFRQGFIRRWAPGGDSRARRRIRHAISRHQTCRARILLRGARCGS